MIGWLVSLWVVRISFVGCLIFTLLFFLLYRYFSLRLESGNGNGWTKGSRNLHEARGFFFLFMVIVIFKNTLIGLKCLSDPIRGALANEEVPYHPLVRTGRLSTTCAPYSTPQATSLQNKTFAPPFAQYMGE